MIEKPDIIETAKTYGCLPAKKSGNRYQDGNCPTGHGSKNEHCWTIYPDTQSFYCFHCRAGGDVIELIKLVLRCDFKDAIYSLKEKGLISGDGFNGASYAELRKVHLILTEAAKFFHANLTDPIREHLQTHYGFTNETIEQYQIAYAPTDKNALRKHLIAKRLALQDIKKTGLLSKYADSFFQGQIMFPYWNQGLVKYFIGRQTKETPKWKKGKYEKLPTTDFIKNDFFYGEDSIRGKDTAYVMEGVTDCLIALQHGLPSISPVTTQFRKTDHLKLLSLLHGRKLILLVPDNEKSGAGMKGAQETLKFLKDNGVNACIITLPRPADQDKIDFNEYVRDNGIEPFHKLVEEQTPVAVPQIIVSKRFLHEKSNEAIRALEAANDPPFIFRRGGTLARIGLDEKNQPRIEILTDVSLRGILARCGHFFKATGKGLAATDPPMEVVKDILALGKWSFPVLEGIVQAPIMRPDGTILVEPGYDPRTCLFYVKPPDLFMPEVPEFPSHEIMEKAREHLLEIIRDFPLLEEADRANALALFFALPLRPAIAGNIPMAVITGPTPGTGKTLLVDAVARVGTGRDAPMAGFSREDDETRKFITASLIAGDPLISFDNLEEPLGGASISRALTCQLWEDRVLSKNLTVRLPQRLVWIANGNNLKLKGDLPRRTFPIRLDAKVSKPWEREGFTHKDLREWVLRSRGDLLAAIFTLARGWFAAGRPEPEIPLPVFGGFEGWAQTIGGILAFAGVGGFLANLTQFHEEADIEGPEWEAFLNAWVEVIGESAKTCQEVASILRDNCEFAATLPDNLQDVLKDPDKSFERSLGRALARKEKRPYGEKNLALQRVNYPRGKVTLWKVAPL